MMNVGWALANPRRNPFQSPQSIFQFKKKKKIYRGRRKEKRGKGEGEKIEE